MMKERRKNPWFTKADIKEFLPAILLAASIGLLLWTLMENAQLKRALEVCEVVEE